ncbi:hypothetical protein [Nostoc sp.]|uniref:hypothetical protein n=1 Tax=Nostoc sp. TaxID=1180 RepID=UPI002FFCE803
MDQDIVLGVVSWKRSPLEKTFWFTEFCSHTLSASLKSSGTALERLASPDKLKSNVNALYLVELAESDWSRQA